MSIATMILGESGSGKSASLRNLDPARTLLIRSIRMAGSPQVEPMGLAPFAGPFQPQGNPLDTTKAPGSPILGSVGLFSGSVDTVSEMLDRGQDPHTHRNEATMRRVYDRRQLIKITPIA